MATPARKTHRTADRILDVTLELFNRFGEPNVSTALISAELGISPGNLYYHYPAKDLLVERLFDRYAASLDSLLKTADEVRHVEDARLFFHMQFELIWQYRFLYRDLNDLLSKNRQIETQFQLALNDMTQAVQRVLAGLTRSHALRLAAPEAESVATAMVVVITYWLSYEYVRDPRHALEPEHAGAALLRGVAHVLSLLAPYVAPAEQRHLRQLAQSGTSVPAPLAEHTPSPTPPHPAQQPARRCPT
jgi:AcrR family transcriptional regulator